jgi:glycosyltransferase involved in cell wall biosynthesis
MEYLISVIVPVYKVEKYLDRCVSSIVNQTYKNLEIILVDDGSPDNCPQKCDEWAEKDSRIKVIHKENGGLSSARNAALDIARGDYIGFVDSDDYIALDMYEKLVGILSVCEVEIVTFGCHKVDENGNIISSTEKIIECDLTSENALKELLKTNINNYMWNKIFKSVIFKEIRFPENRVWEDMAICYKLFLLSEKIYCYPQELYFYYINTNSITKNMNEKTLRDIFLARYECYMFIKNKYDFADEYALPLAALAARRFFDRSLWADVDASVLELAKNFLSDNKESILKNTNDKVYNVYYSFPKIYVCLRKLKHIIGRVVKKIKK